MRRLTLVAVALFACSRPQDVRAFDSGPDPDPPEARQLRSELVGHLATKVHDERVLDAMQRVPRHLFVPRAPLARAYEDVPLPIGHDQTISQPYIVATMTEALDLHGTERVLEIGTGSGYQAAVLSLLARVVYTIEVIPALAEDARARLAELGYANVVVLIGDGYKGWPDQAPFDRIIVTAAPPEVPAALFDQLGERGLLVAPVGESRNQRLFRYRKTEGTIHSQDLGGVRFVPMVPSD